MYFKQLAIGGYDDNFSYLIGDEKSREVAVVDPDNFEMIQAFIEEENLVPVAVLITHEHFDHVCGVEAFRSVYDVPVYIHEAGKGAIDGEEVRTVRDGAEIGIGDLIVRVLHTPGHARGAVCYLAEGKLITGDTLFVGGCGRADLEGSDVDALYESLFEKISTLPDETEVYPGHDYGDRPFSTIGQEKKENRFLLCAGKESFVKERMR